MSALDLADVGTVQARALSEALLRQATLVAKRL